MSIAVEILDADPSGASAVGLLDLLALIESRGRVLTWSVLELHATGDPSRLGESILDLEARIRDSPRGVILSWDELTRLAGALDQIIDIVIVGVNDIRAIPSLGPNCDLKGPSEFVLEAIDGCAWRVYSRDDTLVDALLRRFRMINIVNV